MAPIGAVTPRTEMTRGQTHHAQTPGAEWGPSGAARGGKGRKLPPYGWTSKNYVICVCFHCHGTSTYHMTNTLQGRRAKIHVDTQTFNRDWGTSYSRPPIDTYLIFPLLQNPGGATVGTQPFIHSFIHIRLLRTVKPQLYTKIKQSACLKYIKVNTYLGTTF